MNDIKLKNLTADQKACLGRVYRFIIERGHKNRNRVDEKQAINHTEDQRARQYDTDHEHSLTKFDHHFETNFS